MRPDSGSLRFTHSKRDDEAPITVVSVDIVHLESREYAACEREYTMAGVLFYQYEPGKNQISFLLGKKNGKLSLLVSFARDIPSTVQEI